MAIVSLEAIYFFRVRTSGVFFFNWIVSKAVLHLKANMSLSHRSSKIVGRESNRFLNSSLRKNVVCWENRKAFFHQVCSWRGRLIGFQLHIYLAVAYQSCIQKSWLRLFYMFMYIDILFQSASALYSRSFNWTTCQCSSAIANASQLSL